MALTVLCLSFVLFLVLGVPVAFAIGLSCLATFAVEGLPFETAIQMMVSGMNVFSFLAIPFFIFSGELMLHGGIADKIVNFARSLVGHWKGGLGLANVVASTLFGVMIPIMKREGYSAAYAVNVTTHASLTGALMPTSHNMIIYAFAAQAATGMIGGQAIKGVSIGDLMFAGLIPVFWIMVCMLAAAYWQAVKFGYPKTAAGTSMVEKFPGWNAVLRAFVASVPGLLVVVIILVCVMEGITTATEAAAIAVTYSLILTIVIYRTMNKEKLLKSLAKASKTTGVILLLIGVGSSGGQQRRKRLSLFIESRDIRDLRLPLVDWLPVGELHLARAAGGPLIPEENIVGRVVAGRDLRILRRIEHVVRHELQYQTDIHMHCAFQSRQCADQL